MGGWGCGAGQVRMARLLCCAAPRASILQTGWLWNLELRARWQARWAGAVSLVMPAWVEGARQGVQRHKDVLHAGCTAGRSQSCVQQGALQAARGWADRWANGWARMHAQPLNPPAAAKPRRAWALGAPTPVAPPSGLPASGKPASTASATAALIRASECSNQASALSNPSVMMCCQSTVGTAAHRLTPALDWFCAQGRAGARQGERCHFAVACKTQSPGLLLCRPLCTPLQEQEGEGLDGKDEWIREPVGRRASRCFWRLPGISTASINFGVGSVRARQPCAARHTLMEASSAS